MSDPVCAKCGKPRVQLSSKLCSCDKDKRKAEAKVSIEPGMKNRQRHIH